MKRRIVIMKKRIKSMNNRIKKGAVKGFTLFLCVGLVAGCSKDPLVPLQTMAIQPYTKTQAIINFCTTDGAALKSEMKFIFVFDRSGSNLLGNNLVDPPQLPTDPDGIRRFFPVLDYLANAPGGYSWDRNGSCSNALYADQFACEDNSEIWTPVPQIPEAQEPDRSIFYSYINLSTAATGYRFHTDPTDPRNLHSVATRNMVDKNQLPISDFTNDPVEFGNQILEVWDPSATVPRPPAWDPTMGDPTDPPTSAVLATPDDGGWTDYKKSLGAVYNLINADVERARDHQEQTGEIIDSYYVVFFITDGFPLIGVTSGGDPIEQSWVDSTEIGISNMVSDLKSFESRTGDRNFVVTTQLHTGFYTDIDPSTGLPTDPNAPRATKLLGDMADLGKGRFIDFGAGRVDYGLFGVPERDVRFGLNDLIVENLSAIWEGGGAVRADTDEDGLSDIIEDAIGSDLNNRDSDGDGISDGIEYTINPASVTSFFNYAAGSCGGHWDGATSTWLDRDKDGLNDCEEQILRTLDADMDSNLDFIPDVSAVRLGLNSLPGSPDQSLLDPDGDLRVNYTEWKEGTPLRTRDSDIVGLRRYYYDMPTPTVNGLQDCYRDVRVKDITTTPTRDGENTVRVWIMESRVVGNTTYKMRCAQKPVSSGTVTFRDTDFTDPSTMCFP